MSKDRSGIWEALAILAMLFGVAFFAVLVFWVLYLVVAEFTIADTELTHLEYEGTTPASSWKVSLPDWDYDAAPLDSDVSLYESDKTNGLITPRDSDDLAKAITEIPDSIQSSPFIFQVQAYETNQVEWHLHWSQYHVTEKNDPNEIGFTVTRRDGIIFTSYWYRVDGELIQPDTMEMKE